MEIRKGTLKDLEAIAAVEAACFPAAEAATAEEFAGRLQQYGDHFWLLWEGERLLAFVDGFCTDWPMRCTPTPPSTGRMVPGR